MTAQEGHNEVVQLLLVHGAEVTQVHPTNGAFALLMAAQQGQAEVVQLLLAHGAEVNQVASNGNFALIVAAHGGHAEVVKILLAHGADRSMSAQGFTPMRLAQQMDRAAIVLLLSDGS